MRKRLFYPVALAAFVACTSASAAVFTLTADITVSQEVGANTPATLGPPTDNTGALRPLSFGSATFVLDTAVPVMTVSGQIFNIDVTGTQTPFTNDNLVAAHIHAPALPGSTAGVVWGFFGTPDNDNINEVVITPFLSGVGGSFSGVWDAPEGNNNTDLVDHIANILAGRSYINFHTVQFPGGEIRGQLVIPEPATVTLVALALLAICLGRRGRQEPKARYT